MGVVFVFFFVTHFEFSEYLYKNIIIKIYVCVITCHTTYKYLFPRAHIVYGIFCILYTFLLVCSLWTDGNSTDSYFPTNKIIQKRWTIVSSRCVEQKNTNRYWSRRRMPLWYNTEFHVEATGSAFMYHSSTTLRVSIIIII